MVHQILYTLHVLGMAAMLFLSFYLLMKKEMQTTLKKKFALYLMSAAHTQLLTGFALFFLMLSQINHAKIGVKFLLAIFVATLASIYKRKIFADQTPSLVLLPALFVTAVIITAIAFLWR